MKEDVVNMVLTHDEQGEVQHFIKHGDQKCKQCVNGLRVYERVLRAKPKEGA